MKSAAQSRAGTEPRRVVAVGDTIISEQGLVAIIGRDPRYHVCGAAHTFEEANKLVRQHRPDVLLIEPFLENRDAIRWIKGSRDGISAHSHPYSVTAIRTDLCGARPSCRSVRLLDEEQFGGRVNARD